jgi:hypothetical protein
MRTHRFTSTFTAGAAMAVAFAGTAQASSNRTFVATYGLDNPSCSASAPCRDFPAALAVTNPGGEIVVLNSGGYGAATISQGVTITAVGVDASITATSGNALTISTSGNVTINGLNLHGSAGAATNGVLVSSVGFLRLYTMVVEGFASNGVQFNATSGALAVYDSYFNDNGHDGLLVQASGARAYVHNSEFDNNQFAGGDSAEGIMTIADSSAHYNTHGFFADGGRLELYGDRAIFNTNGLRVNASGHLYFADCLIADNTNWWNVDAGGVLSGSNPGTTLVAPGQATTGSGTIAPATVLQ